MTRKIVDKFTKEPLRETKESFKGSDNKYHYVYLTIHNDTGRFYIGKRTEKKISKQYIGSGVGFTHAKKKYGSSAFTKVILSFHNTEDDAYEQEKLIITPEMVKSCDCFNRNLGGREFGEGLYNPVHKLIVAGTHNFLGHDHPTKKASANGSYHKIWPRETNVFVEDNPSKKAAIEGRHWAKGTDGPWKNASPWSMSAAIKSYKAMNTWCLSDEVYTHYVDTNLKTGGRRLFNYFSKILPVNERTFESILKKFKAGWIPDQDQEWLKLKQTYKVTSDEQSKNPYK